MCVCVRAFIADSEQYLLDANLPNLLLVSCALLNGNVLYVHNILCIQYLKCEFCLDSQAVATCNTPCVYFAAVKTELAAFYLHFYIFAMLC